MVPAGGAVTLSAESSQEFNRYVQRIEKELLQRAAGGRVAGFPGEGRKSGAVEVYSPADENPLDIGSAYIHDWAGKVFVPGGTAGALLAVLRDYGRHKEFYAPEVIDSRHLGGEGDELRSFLRLRKKKVLTVILDSEYRSRFVEAGKGAGYSISHSTSIREVENAGTKTERALPVGEGHGFLWRLNAYWAWQETGGGLWVECRAVSLSRDVPSGLGWAVNPIVRSLPRESLEATLDNTRKAVLAAVR